MLRWITAGESHGRALVAVVEGMVAGVHVTSADIADQLARRRLGYGRGARMTFERDAVTVLSGIRHGSTLGGPIAIEIGNTEWPKWETVMAADPVDPAELADVARNAPLTRPRPGERGVACDVGQLGGVDRVGGHHGLPFGPFGVADLDGDGPAQGAAVAYPGQHGHRVALERHPCAAAVAQPASGQLVGDVGRGDVHAGDHAFDHGHQGAAV